MNRENLYELLDIESAADFEYFENMASLLECGEDIPYEEITMLLKDVDKVNLAELINNYFEEISDFIPDEETGMFLSMDKIRLSLMGLARGSEDEGILAKLADELDRFRRWYSDESRVVCRSVLNGDEELHCLRDALALARVEKIDGDKYEYDFSDCTDYPIEEYVMSFGDMMAAEERDSRDDGNGENP